jgi:hypothetical protein
MDGYTLLGALISGVCLAIAEKTELILHGFLHIVMPPIVMQSCQAFAWIMTGVAASVTVFSWWEKRKHKKQKEDK